MFERVQATKGVLTGEGRPGGVRLAAAVVEGLEGRVFMSATLRGATLVLKGTPSDDVISVAPGVGEPATLVATVNGEAQSFDAARVKRIRANGLGGDDVITIGGNAGAVAVPAKLNGGKGDDELFGGDAADVLRGGRGDDELGGGGGADRISGGAGEDVFQSTDAPAENADFSEDDDGVRISLAEAPPAVQAAVATLLAGAPFGNLFQEVDEGATVYELEWTAAEGPKSAKIALDGTVVELETEIDPATLPAAVVAAITARYPAGEITEAETVVLPDNPLLYEVEVVNRRTIRELLVTPAGEIIDDSVEGRVGQ